MRKTHPEIDIESFEWDYVLPGLIDLGVRCNGSWGNSETESKAAVAGGVTFFLEEPSAYQLSAPSLQLYCDVGRCGLLGSSNLRMDLQSQDFSDVFAVKAYLSPISSVYRGVRESLDFLLQQALEVPLILDCFLPSDGSLRINSPFRLSSLEDRESAILSSRLNHGDGFSSDVTPSLPDDDRGLLAPIKKRSRDLCEDVVDELQQYRKVHGRKETYEALSKVSLLEYDHSGTTSYQHESTPVPTPAPKTNKPRRRPSAISVTPFRNSEAEAYVNYYSQYPEDTETSGVEALLSALKLLENQAGCRIHVANVCSASAICSVLSFKPHFHGHLTIETAPHYLIYTKDQVETGNTRFKVCPPLRCSENQNFLWKLLRADGLDTISSNHCSVSLDYKFLNSGSFKRAVSGIATLGFGLRALISKSCSESTEIINRERDLIRLATMMAITPANVIGVETKRGTIDIQKYADLVVFAPFEAPSTGQAHGKWPQVCPFTSQAYYGQVKKVFLRGQTAYSNGCFYPVGRNETRKAYK